MRSVAVITQDFRIYYDVVKTLKERNVPFVCLKIGKKIPKNVGVVITTKEESSAIKFQNKVEVNNRIDAAVKRAVNMLHGKKSYQQLIIGIDPGMNPGLALIGDDVVLDTMQASSPENTANIVTDWINAYTAKKAWVRIGHSSLTHRNRIINVLSPLKLKIEIVDERNTTKRIKEPDTHAAMQIASSRGYLAQREYEINPTLGELRDIQRSSRIKSGGRITISRETAEKVARGELSLDDALKKRKVD